MSVSGPRAGVDGDRAARVRYGGLLALVLAAGGVDAATYLNRAPERSAAPAVSARTDPRSACARGEGSGAPAANIGHMPKPPSPGQLGRRAAAWSLGWCFAAGFYLLLIDITDLPELIVGAGAAVLAATGLELAREQGIVGESIRLRWLLRLHRPLLKVPSDIAFVSLVGLRALVRRDASLGRFRAVRFSGGADEQRESGRRALAEAFGSFAPNTIIVGIDGDRGLILAHQLRPTGGREAIDLLELG